MQEQINKNELEELSTIGATDGNEEIAPTSVFTSIVASIYYCSPISLATASLSIYITGKLF